MDINEIREKIKSNDCNTDDLLNAIQNLRNENSNDEILHELDLLENKVRSSQTNFDDKNDPDRVPITLDNMLPNYRLDKENMRYIDEKTGNPKKIVRSENVRDIEQYISRIDEMIERKGELLWH